MPQDKGSKLAKFLGQAIERLKGRRPDLNPKGQTRQSTTGPARAAKKARKKQLRAGDIVAKAEAARQKPKPEPVSDHRIDVYRNLVSMLIEAKTKLSGSEEQKRTKPATSKAYKARKKALLADFKNKRRHDELEADYGDTSIMRQGIER